MSELKAPRISVVPFLIGDLLLLAVAGGIVYQNPWPLGTVPAVLCTLAVALGAWILVVPYILEHKAQTRLLENESLRDAASAMKTLTQVQEQIGNATGTWNNIQGECAKAITAAQDVSTRMTAEAAAFKDFLQKTNDSEKATLRLEVDKRQRMEMEWVQVVVRMMDNVHALYQAALQSGQTNLITQIGQFQFTCRDAGRRVGLSVFDAEPGELFNSERHQLLDGAPENAASAKVAKTVAPGINLQGRLLRPALVVLDQPQAFESPTAAPALDAPEAEASVAGVVPPASGNELEPTAQPTLL